MASRDFSRPKWRKSDYHVRRDVVEKLSDHKQLAEIVRNDSDYHVREAAVKKLSDQELLAEIARNDSDYRVRKAAMEKLSAKPKK